MTKSFKELFAYTVGHIVLIALLGLWALYNGSCHRIRNQQTQESSL